MIDSEERERKWWSRWDGQWITKMLLKQQVSGYWEQTAPKVTRNGETTCLIGAIGESERVSTLLGWQMKWLLMLFVERWDLKASTRPGAQRIQVKPNGARTDARTAHLENNRTTKNWENLAVPSCPSTQSPTKALFQSMQSLKPNTES